MTHPTGGTCGIMHRGARRGARDFIRDGANRIDAREPLSYAAAAGRLPQLTHRADISEVHVSTKGGPISTKMFLEFLGGRMLA